jgi:hypothetical protein
MTYQLIRQEETNRLPTVILSPTCHSEQREESHVLNYEILRFTQDDSQRVCHSEQREESHVLGNEIFRLLS